jgi:hypothetical protein
MIDPALKKVYLGDGLYAEFNGHSITLSTPRQDGEHFVVLEDHVLIQFQLWINALMGEVPDLRQRWSVKV